MKTRRFPFLSTFRSGCLGLIVACGWFLGAAPAPAQTNDNVYLKCENDYHPPLFAFDLPLFPQILNVKIVILTNANTPVLSHSVIVVNTDTGNNVGIFNFNVLPGGTVGPREGASVMTQGQSPSGTPYQYLSTNMATWAFGGDNFPLGAWPDDPNWKAPPVINHMQLNLDQAAGWLPDPANSRNFTIESDYHYTKWAWSSFLGFELPYLPGASAAGPISKTITFDLRGSPTVIPPRQKPDQPYVCHICKECLHPHMAGASLDQFQAGIAITDTPISYTPGVGRNMAFTVSYHQRLTNQPSTFMYSNLGQQWNGNWISYITGGPSNGQSDAIYRSSDGSQFTYGGYQPTVAQGTSATEVNQGDFQATEGWTHATLHYRQGPERYERWLPDGTVETYAQPAGVAGNRMFFLTLIKDPQGNTTTLNYDANAAANGQAVLTSVTDPVGGKLLFSYDTANPLQIAKVTRSSDQLAAKFTYTNGQLTSITDPIGITSSFHYTTGTSFIDTMTTPYGVTSFGSTDGPSSLEADITNPLGEIERVEYQESLTGTLMPSASPTPSGSFTIDTSNLNTANSFYWSRRAMADSGNVANDSSAVFYGRAEVTHWAQGDAGSIPVALCTKMPLEGWVWFNYPGQGSVDYVLTNLASASVSPSITARVVETATGSMTQTSQASYNANGLITQSIDPIGRKTTYNYDTNGIDLLSVTQLDSGSQDTLSTMTYNSTHLPLTVKDASGQTTTMTYNGQGQLLTSTDALSHTTTLAYDTNGDGYLHTVTGPVSGAVTTYTYDSVGRTSTVTDSEGYIQTYAYDNLDRVTSVTYPDGTTDQTAYKALDVIETTDRQGRSTYMKYDAIRELLQTTDPLGRTTQYSWCTCGGLSTLTDANNNVTSWGLDLQGRVTSKTYAGISSSTINYYYESNSGLLHYMTDAMGSTSTYSYNADNTLAGTSYSTGSGVAATPNVSFAYDVAYNRVTMMSDVTGTTTYSYNPITGSTTTGAGRLSSVVTPTGTTSATITYGYDAVGRVVERDVDHATTDANNAGTTFDALGRVSVVTNALTPTGDFTYTYLHETNLVSNVVYPASCGLSGTYAYYTVSTPQDFERLKRIQNMKGSTQLSRFDYTYKPVGTIATWKTQTGTTTMITNTLGYDNADQLTSNAQTGGATAGDKYNYDPAGNRLAQLTLSGSTVTATTGGLFNNLNQLTSYSGTTTASTTTVSGTTSAAVSSVIVNGVMATLSGSTSYTVSIPTITGTNVLNITALPATGASATQRFAATVSGSGTTGLSYDANGNTTTDENGNTYTWDALNRLTKITYPSTAYTTMAYDGLSRRTQIAEYTSTGTLASTKNYLWIGSEIAEERDAGNTVTKRFFQQGEQQSGANYYYTRDHLGSVREMCSSTGTITSRMSYDPYGRTTTVSGITLPTKQYAGMYLHGPSGLYLTNAGDGRSTGRPYKPNTGTWLSRDPLGEGGGANLYDYVGDDPIDNNDPSGLSINWTITKRNLDESGHDALSGMSPAEELIASWCAHEAGQKAEELVRNGQTDGPQDALRHCMWSCCMARLMGAQAAKVIGDNHENRNDKYGENNPGARNMDQSNNKSGRASANCSGSCADSCLAKLKKGRLTGINGKPQPYP